MIPPLCIIQARYHSTRLPGKMLMTLPTLRWPSNPEEWREATQDARKVKVAVEETLIARAVRLARLAFGAEVRVAIPLSDNAGPLGDELRRIDANVCAWDGPEWDVLGRFLYAAEGSRWHPDAVIHRWTPDDPFKAPARCREVAEGARHPVELGGEAWTLAMLREKHRASFDHLGEEYFREREHFGSHAKMVNPGWTVDTIEDYHAARARAVEECR